MSTVMTTAKWRKEPIVTRVEVWDEPEQTEPKISEHTDGYREVLGNGTVPCPDCGVAVPTRRNEGHAEVFVLYADKFVPSGRLASSEPVAFRRCGPCGELHNVTAGLVLALGDRGVTLNGFRFSGKAAMDVVHNVVCALAAVGKPLPPTATADDVRGALRLAQDVEVSTVTWSAEFVPVYDGKTPLGTAQAEPWGHLSDDMRAKARKLAARVMAGQLANGTVEVPCPSEACAYCGVSAVVRDAKAVAYGGGLAVAVSNAWHPIFNVSGAALGAKDHPPVTGHVCPDCDAAIDSAGGHGRGARIMSWLRYHKAKNTNPDNVNVAVAAWAVRPNAKPAKTRWAFARKYVPTPSRQVVHPQYTNFPELLAVGED